VTSGPITFWFGTAPDFAAASAANPTSHSIIDPAQLGTWSAQEITAFGTAMAAYSAVSRLSFALAISVADADMVWWQLNLGDGFLGRHDPPRDGPSWGVFNDHDRSWPYLRQGGQGFTTIIHELGHAVALAHPHDGGSGPSPTRFPGVSANEETDTGTAGLNQSIWTVMSYNVGWDGADVTWSYGGQAGLGAFDIAALQALYGANHSTRTGNDTYVLRMVTGPGTGWSCIWDAGGIDTISAGATVRGATIDLRAASLREGSPHAAGFPSHGQGIAGGFTIAKGSVIENAVGGSGNDLLVGNGSNNVLKGRSGADTLRSQVGNDTLVGGGGRDVFVFDTRLSPTRNVDLVEDFAPRYDRIQLDDSVFSRLGQRGVLDDQAFYATRSSRLAHDATDRIVYQTSTGKLFYDRDGVGPAEPMLFAKLDLSLKLSASDFLVI
jgi:serralysin